MLSKYNRSIFGEYIQFLFDLISLEYYLRTRFQFGNSCLMSSFTSLLQIFPVVFLAAQYLDPLLVLGFTTERYISICHPFKREQYCTVRRAKMVIIALVASATCLSCVQGYFYTHNSSTSDCGPREQVTLLIILLTDCFKRCIEIDLH